MGRLTRCKADSRAIEDKNVKIVEIRKRIVRGCWMETCKCQVKCSLSFVGLHVQENQQ